MKAVQKYIGEKQEKFAQHPFFQALNETMPLQQVMSFAPKLTFWVMAFQDVLRLNESLVQDPQLRRLAVKHRQEDSGHDNWFLQDLARLGNASGDAAALFGPDSATTRDATYALMAEVIHAPDEHLRIVLLLALEAAGHVFFERISQYIESKGYSKELKYFSNYHLDVEKDHDLFTDDTDDEIERMVLSEPLRASATVMIDRAFNSFSSMFDGLLPDIQRPVNVHQVATVSNRPAVSGLR